MKCCPDMMYVPNPDRDIPPPAPKKTWNWKAKANSKPWSGFQNPAEMIAIEEALDEAKEKGKEIKTVTKAEKTDNEEVDLNKESDDSRSGKVVGKEEEDDNYMEEHSNYTEEDHTYKSYYTLSKMYLLTEEEPKDNNCTCPSHLRAALIKEKRERRGTHTLLNRLSQFTAPVQREKKG